MCYAFYIPNKGGNELEKKYWITKGNTFIFREKRGYQAFTYTIYELTSITVDDTTDPNFITLFYQVKLLKEEGLIEANISNGDLHTVFSLTSSGQDKVQFIKNDTLFNRALVVFKKQALPITITLLADYAKSKLF